MTQILTRLAAILMASFAALAISGWLGTMHQGEDRYLIGQIVIWSATAALASAIVAAILTLVNLRCATIATFIAVFSALPMTVFGTFPVLWCQVMVCSGTANDWPFEWMMLVIPASLLSSIMLLHRLRNN